MITILRLFIYFSLSIVIFIALCYFGISWRTNSLIFSDIGNTPKKHIAVVLGTSKYLSNGMENEFYQHRIDAAIELYQANKVSFFIVSGDNRKSNYNEPKQMKKDLIAAGIPSDNIQPDYAGFRTLDSILRMKKVFGHDEYIIISQRFHNQRALFLATHHGHSAIAYNAANPKTHSMKKVIVREFLARVKAVFDIITNKQAKFYGPAIAFPPQPTA